MSLDYAFKDPQLYPGTLRGYRAWGTVGTPRLGLQALAFGTVWTPGVNEAICQMYRGRNAMYDRFQPEEHQSPMLGCTCGFYATYDQSFPNSVLKRPTYLFVDPSPQGSIKASGRIILGTKGFRAEKVELEALVRFPTGGMPYGQLAEVYNVPLYETWKELLVDFPPVNVEALIGPIPPVWRQWVDNLFGHDWNLSDRDAERIYQWADVKRGGDLRTEVTYSYGGNVAVLVTNMAGQVIQVVHGQTINWNDISWQSRYDDRPSRDHWHFRA